MPRRFLDRKKVMTKNTKKNVDLGGLIGIHFSWFVIMDWWKKCDWWNFELLNQLNYGDWDISYEGGA